MADLKTKPTGEDVGRFLMKISDEKRRQDCFTLLEMMQQITKTQPKLWASSMVGFGEHHYKYASGHEGDTFIVGFSPRKQNLTLYVLAGFDQQAGLLERLGKHKSGKGCLYLKSLEDVHLPTLRRLIQQSVAHTQRKQPAAAQRDTHATRRSPSARLGPA
jgi:hypothetical protein